MYGPPPPPLSLPRFHHLPLSIDSVPAKLDGKCQGCTKLLTLVYSDEIAPHFRGALLVKHYPDALGPRDRDLPTRASQIKNRRACVDNRNQGLG